MISQGFPLWAVNEDGTPFLVVGWEEIPTDGPWPLVVSLDTPQGVARAGLGELFTFTTTDPSVRSDVNKITYELADLRARLANLADEWEQGPTSAYRLAASKIRQELDR